MAINKENFKKWLTALRSGEFKQGRGRLQTGDGGYCCMGVACEVYRRETKDGTWIPSSVDREPSFSAEGDNEDPEYRLFLPPSVRDWLGLPSDNPRMRVNDRNGARTASASDLNDIMHWTFAQIADALEQNFLAEVS